MMLTKIKCFHLIHEIPEREFFGWCTGGCWIAEAKKMLLPFEKRCEQRVN